MTAPAVHVALGQFFDQLADIFSACDLPRFRALYRFPCQVVTSAGVHALPDTEAFDRFFAPMLARLQRDHFARSVWRDLTAVRLGPALALASMHWTRLRDDGSVIETLGATYTLREDALGWGIVSLVGHAAEHVPTLA